MELLLFLLVNVVAMLVAEAEVVAVVTDATLHYTTLHNATHHRSAVRHAALHTTPRPAIT